MAVQFLDEWASSVDPNYLQECTAPLTSALMSALYLHVKPASPMGPKVAALLGKFGGSNRKFLGDYDGTDHRENLEHGLRLVFGIEPSTGFLVPVDKLVSLAERAVEGVQVSIF